MSTIINFLLAEQPSEADSAILAFLEARQAGATTPTAKPPSRSVVLRDRLYMAQKVIAAIFQQAI